MRKEARRVDSCKRGDHKNDIMGQWPEPLRGHGLHSYLPELAYISIHFHRPHYVEHFKGYKDVIHQTEGSIYKTDGL